MKNRLAILNIWVDPITSEQAIAQVLSYLQNGTRPHSIFAANPEKNFSVPKDPKLYQVYRQADVLLPDGIGVVLAANWLYGAGIKRIPGSDFMLDICKLAAGNGNKVFIYGATEDVNRQSVKILQKRYPTLQIVGRSNGYVPKDDMRDVLQKINDSGADILFIALGSPQQEKWFADWKHELKNVRVVQGVGGTLDTIGGNVKRAPDVWCKFNVEWLYRLLCEPKRIKRQKLLPVFVFQLLLEARRLKLSSR